MTLTIQHSVVMVSSPAGELQLSAYGARVLAIDADPQGNLTSAFDLEGYGYIIDEETPILVDVITENCTATEAIVEVTPLLHLLPSTPLNATLEGRIREHSKNPSLALNRITSPIKDKYDYVLIDCAPALNLTNTATVSASDLVILPVAPDKFSQIGVEQTMAVSICKRNPVYTAGSVRWCKIA